MELHKVPGSTRLEVHPMLSTHGLPETGGWKAFARCRGVDPEIFYPPPDDDGHEAKQVCEPCPVREACLEHALTVREKQGVWGGMTERERRRVLRRRRRSA